MLAAGKISGHEMRQIVLLAVGIVVGAAAGISLVNTLRQRDAYPRGLMDVMQHQYASLRNDVRDGHCQDSAQHLLLLRTLSRQIGEAVYGEDIPDSPFREFQSRLGDALADTPADCKGFATQTVRIGSACDACHRQYR
jgi:hypothetical protein